MLSAIWAEKRKSRAIPLQIIGLEMEPHLCRVADVVAYIPVDLWAFGANINAITYPVSHAEKENPPPL